MNIPTHLLPMRIGREEEADYKRRVYFLSAPPGTTPEHVVDPDYWVHWAHRLQINDRVEIVAVDGSFDMEVRVTAIDPRRLWAHVRPLRVAEGKFAVPEASGQYPDNDGYTVEWGGPHRWRIVRGNDVVARDFPNQESAIEVLQQIKAAKRPVLMPQMSDPPPQPEQPPIPMPPPAAEPPAEEQPAEPAEPEGARARTPEGRFVPKPKAA